MAGILSLSTIKSGAANVPPAIQDSAGTEVGQLCTAWVNFNGHTGAVVSGFNVASITIIGNGIYNVVFASPMTTSGYAVSSSVTTSSAVTGTAGSYGGCATYGDTTNPIYGDKTLLKVRVNTATGSSIPTSYNMVSVQVFGGK